MKKKAIVLLSGGMDSATTMAMARSRGFELYALSFDYGQKNHFEIKQAKKIARHFGARKHLILDVDIRKIGGSALTSSIPIPRKRSDKDRSRGIPLTYVPARNTLFLSFALAWGETLPAKDIFIGVNYLDSSGYPDCRPEYIRSFENMARLATRMGTEGKQRIRIHTPLIRMKKREIIKAGARLGVDFSMTSSCYEPSSKGMACGFCDSCLLRLKGFREAGLKDPIQYIRQK
ncbi:MAG: 7-cyano-7-deazaguanine synthase QueC [Acidobacteriota bacterium]